LGKSASWLVLITSGPYEHGLETDPAIDVIMAAGAFGQQAAVVFMGDGLNYLNTDLAPKAGHSDLRKLLKSLPIYDVDDVFVWAEDKQTPENGFSIPVKPISMDGVSELLSQADHVVSF